MRRSSLTELQLHVKRYCPQSVAGVAVSVLVKQMINLLDDAILSVRYSLIYILNSNELGCLIHRQQGHHNTPDISSHSLQSVKINSLVVSY